MDFKILPFELKSASGDGSEFSGHCNAFFNIDAAQEIVDTGSFIDTIPQFMENGFIGGLNHDWGNPIGKPMSAKEDAVGLYVDGKVSSTSHGKDCMILLKDRVIKKMSIGYRVLGSQMLEDADAVAAYWKDRGYTPTTSDIAAAQYGARLLTKLHLFEFSPVTVPANSLADITRVKRYDTDEMISYADIEKRLCDVGLSRKAAKIWISGIKALHQRDVEEAKPPETQTPPTEPEPPTEPSPPIAEPEVKQEPISTETAPVSVAGAVVVKADSRRVSAALANFLTIQANIHA